MLKFLAYHLFAFLILFGTATLLQAQTPLSPLIVSDFDWSTNGERIAIGYSQWGNNNLQSCGTGSDLKVFVVDTSQVISYPRTTTGCAPSTADFNVTATTMVVVSSSRVENWDLNANLRISSGRMETNFQAASYSPDGSNIAVTSWVGVSINSSSLQGGGGFSIPRDDSSRVLLYSAWSPNGQMIATSGDGGQVYVWQVTDGQILATFTGHTTPVKRLAWDPTSTQIVSGDDSGNIRIWDADTGTSIRSLTGHTGVVYDVDWRPNGADVVSGGADGLRVWNAATGTGRLVNSTLTSAVAYNPTGTQLAVGGVITDAASLTISVIDAPPVVLPPTTLTTTLTRLIP